jgi:hypothetical protein
VRATMITKLKAVEKEREGLEGRKLEAEAYLAKQGERLRASITGNKILLHQTQVGVLKCVWGGGNALVGQKILLYQTQVGGRVGWVEWGDGDRLWAGIIGSRSAAPEMHPMTPFATRTSARPSNSRDSASNCWSPAGPTGGH